jgi:hypothetical protein
LRNHFGFGWSAFVGGLTSDPRAFAWQRGPRFVDAFQTPIRGEIDRSCSGASRVIRGA